MVEFVHRMPPTELNGSSLDAVCVVADGEILGGQPVVSGTRVPALTIIEYLRQGQTSQEIFDDYPSLSAEALRAVEVWAAGKFGPDWKMAASISS